MALEQTQAAANKKLALKLVWIIAGALLFAFALVPLYDVICSVTGLNGKTKSTPESASQAVVDLQREVTVQFVSSVMPGLGWNFYPKQSSVKVHPGQVTTVMFEAKNTTNVEVAGQAIPSVTPGKASAHLKKIECFCFVRQTLKPGEVRALPLRFFVSAELPKDVQEMTLSYSFFPASQ
ncbi:cytochrome c oxidase assembly protein [Methylophilus sp.]|uniref:cytochrome c oxidase assembly protein n=1 Tax=Methylophilus sp. TaxID=29541 RepID=UPI0011DB282F|nr:cytochrome c oxidase assembly protein [Methylophilus sp.]TXI47161.1 MAG: cytochrome c oxidase assembly protein [Methylophilus sp.]